jgi:sigma-B regulation protein RsbU (phosphoserine phosphatase)
MPVKRPIFRYCVLAILFVITVLYEVRYVSDIIRTQALHVPLVAPEAGTNKIDLLSPDAAQTGLKAGERILAVNGVPYTGTGQLGDANAHATPGTPIALTVGSTEPTRPGQRTVFLPVTRIRVTFWDVAGDLVLHILLPATSLLLGFWVALVRPRDPRAWLLFALMMTFPHIYETFTYWGWGPGWREAGMLYHAPLAVGFPIVMFLFGRNFPEPFPKGSRYDRLWNILQWAVALPFAILGLEAVVILVRQLSDYKSVAALNHFFSPLDRMDMPLGYLLIGSFFAATGIKLTLSPSPDSRRRLLLLYWGGLVAFFPSLSLTLIGRVIGKPIVEVSPQWLIIFVLSFLLLFPLTLAYVIVVQKAMPVGVAIRQGLQYALAKGGLRALQILAVAAIIFATVHRKLL